MCVGFWTLEHPDYALVLCTNRDEFLARPTVEAHFHSFESGSEFPGSPEAGGSVLSGRDLRAGGTWLGMNRNGKIALLTNITEQPGNYTSSRGHLASSYLLSSASTSLNDELQRISAQDGKYAGFNLLLLAPSQKDDNELSFEGALVTNHGGGGPIASRPLNDSEKQCAGMSNGIDGLGADKWPKVVHGTQTLRGILDSFSAGSDDSKLMDSLFELLQWRSREPPRDRAELRNTIHIEPMNVSQDERRNGRPAYYGTRLSTVVLIRKDGRVLFVERDIWQLDENGEPKKSNSASQRVFHFPLNKRA